VTSPPDVLPLPGVSIEANMATDRAALDRKIGSFVQALGAA
jgi:hypothetical protein